MSRRHLPARSKPNISRVFGLCLLSYLLPAIAFAQTTSLADQLASLRVQLQALEARVQALQAVVPLPESGVPEPETTRRSAAAATTSQTISSSTTATSPVTSNDPTSKDLIIDIEDGRQIVVEDQPTQAEAEAACQAVATDLAYMWQTVVCTYAGEEIYQGVFIIG